MYGRAKTLEFQLFRCFLGIFLRANGQRARAESPLPLVKCSVVLHTFERTNAAEGNRLWKSKREKTAFYSLIGSLSDPGNVDPIRTRTDTAATASKRDTEKKEEERKEPAKKPA